MSKKTLFTLGSHDPSNFTEYFVEEKRPSGRWKLISENPGPYTSFTKATDQAISYGKAHQVQTRVVGDV